MSYLIVETKLFFSQRNFPLKIQYFYRGASFLESMKTHSFLSVTYLDIEINVVYYIELYPEEL